MSDKTLKAQNVKWLVMLALLDTFVVLLCVVPELADFKFMSNIVIARTSGTAVLPVVVLLLVELIPPNAKATLVYWRLRQPLPGSRAFSKYALDPRIDMEALKKNVGAFPGDPAEQNSRWYKLYKLVINDKAVIEAHKNYLMYRDMTAISILLAAVVPIGLAFTPASPSVKVYVLLFFAVQFAVCALNARNSGIRMVRNVLAAHGSAKIAGSKATAKATPGA